MELEKAKEQIFEKLSLEEEKRKKDKDLLEELRAELYLEEYEEQLRRKDREEHEKHDK